MPATGQGSSLSGNVATDSRLGWLTVWAVKVGGLNSPLMPLPLLLRDFARSRDNSTTQREFRISANHSARSFNCGTVLDTENIKWKLFQILLNYATVMVIFMYVIVVNALKNRYVHSKLARNSIFSSYAGRLQTAWPGRKHGAPVMAATWGVRPLRYTTIEISTDAKTFVSPSCTHVQVEAQPDHGPGSEIGTSWKIGVTWSRKRSFKMAAAKLGYLLTKSSFSPSLWHDISISWHGRKEL